MSSPVRLKENKHPYGNIQEKHLHENHQILYVLNNQGKLYLSDEEHLFDKGSLVFIPPQVSHSVYSAEKMTVLVLEFEQEKLDSTNKSLIRQSFFEEAKIFSPAILEENEVRTLFRRILYENSKNLPMKETAMQIYLAELLLIILRLPEEEQHLPNYSNQLRAQQAKEYIDTHYFKIRTAEELAGKFKITRKYLTNLFKSEYSQTPFQYLTKVRIEAAEILLKETTKDISTICFEVGFDSLSTFYRNFKAVKGTSPKNYRISQKFYK